VVDGGGVAEVRVQLGLYRRILAARLRSDWQYRTSFLLLLASQTVAAGLDLAAIVVIFGRVDALAGWSVVQVGLLYGIAGVAFAVGDLFVSQVEEASRHIKAGTFDRFLLRPVWPLLQLSADEFALRRVGKVLQPAAVLLIALARARIRWTPARAVLLPISLASGVVIFGAIWVITSSVAFWMVETQEFANAFTYGGNHVTQYPIDVLGAWLRRLATFLVPLAFVAYYPASYLLAKGTRVGLAFLSPAVAAVLAVAAASVWRNAIRHYRSTGS
jgi:ABC-2 type transport system permease protein